VYPAHPFSQAFPADPDSTITVEALQARIAEVEASSTLDEPAKGRLTELYRKALTELERARSLREMAEYYQQARRIAPDETRAIRIQLEKTRATSPVNALQILTQHHWQNSSRRC
jgi:hypothetical protein